MVYNAHFTAHRKFLANGDFPWILKSIYKVTGDKTEYSISKYVSVHALDRYLSVNIATSLAATALGLAVGAFPFANSTSYFQLNSRIINILSRNLMAYMSLRFDTQWRCGNWRDLENVHLTFMHKITAIQMQQCAYAQFSVHVQ